MPDDTPCANWHLAVVEDTISGEDSLVRAANVRTSTVYLLEITAADPLPRQNSSPKTTSSDSDVQSSSVEQDDNTKTQERRPVCHVC